MPREQSRRRPVRGPSQSSALDQRRGHQSTSTLRRQPGAQPRTAASPHHDDDAVLSPSERRTPPLTGGAGEQVAASRTLRGGRSSGRCVAVALTGGCVLPYGDLFAHPIDRAMADAHVPSREQPLRRLRVCHHRSPQVEVGILPMPLGVVPVGREPDDWRDRIRQREDNLSAGTRTLPTAGLNTAQHGEAERSARQPHRRDSAVVGTISQRGRPRGQRGGPEGLRRDGRRPGTRSRLLCGVRRGASSKREGEQQRAEGDSTAGHQRRLAGRDGVDR